tara:strand:+ start:1828 stop:2034 length:207 start_codon:yes stop_codon:yes gene_type:complete
MNEEERHEKRELQQTLVGLKEILSDLTSGEIKITLARLEERVHAHGKLIAALGGAISLIAGALAVLAD